MAKAEGVKVKWVYNNYKADHETKAIQNLISLGVDGINLTAVTPESARVLLPTRQRREDPHPDHRERHCRGPGQAIGIIDFDWAGIYRYVADNLRKDSRGDLSMIWIQGMAGSRPSCRGSRDSRARCPSCRTSSLPPTCSTATTPWTSRSTPCNAIIQSGLKFNVAIGGSQEMADGISTALKNANMRDKVKVVSVNGGPMDVDNFAKGNLDYALSQSPGLHGMITAANLIAYLRGQTYQTKTFSPVIWVNAQTYKKDLIPWDMDTSWMPVVNEFVKTGKVQAGAEIASRMMPRTFVFRSLKRGPGRYAPGAPFMVIGGGGGHVESGNILETRGLSKSYPGVQALDSVDFDLRFGEVQALVGQNGAGKSTLIEIIAGSLRPDSGTILIGGQEFSGTRPVALHRAGRPDGPPGQPARGRAVSGGEHLPLTTCRRAGRGSCSQCTTASSRAKSSWTQLGIDVSPRRKMKDLTFIERKLVSIAKAFSRSARILILDEPTASLDEKGKKGPLSTSSARHTRKGLSVIYISHNLGEIFEVCDRVTVMVDGRKVDTSPVKDVTMNDVVHRMIGRTSSPLYCREEAAGNAAAERPRHPLSRGLLTARGVVEHVSFEVRPGEIFGLGGLVGSGRTELARMIFGLDRKDSGRLLLRGKDITPALSVRCHPEGRRLPHGGPQDHGAGLEAAGLRKHQPTPVSPRARGSS